MLRHVLQWVCACALAGAAAVAFGAVVPAVQIGQLDPAIGACQTAPGGGAFNCGDFSLGFAFTAQQDLSVVSLGVFATGGVLQAAHEVILYDAAGTPLVAASVDNSGSLQGFFRYADLQSPYSLNAGQQYVLATYYAPGVDFYARDPLDISFFGISFLENRVKQGSGFPSAPEPTFPGFQFGWFGPNMLVDTTSSSGEPVAAVPLPAALPLLAFGLGGLLSWNARKAKPRAQCVPAREARPNSD